MRLCAPPARRACALLPAGTRAREQVSAARQRGGICGARRREGGAARRGGGCAAPPEARCQTGRQMKYILVTGGVISGIGKGIIASSIGTILKSSGLRVTSIKIDPYINIDAGTFSPYEHGERRAGGSQHGSALRVLRAGRSSACCRRIAMAAQNRPARPPLRARWPHPCGSAPHPGMLSPVPLHHCCFGEEIAPNAQAGPPLVQLEAVASHPVAVTREHSPILSVPEGL